MRVNPLSSPSLLVPTRWLACCWLGAWTAVAAEAPSLSPSPAAGAALSLEDLVVEVLRMNPELEFYRAEIAAAQAGKRTAREWENPELSAAVGSKRVGERGGAPLGDGVAWSVSVSQTFEFPGRIALRKAIANRQIELARLGLEHFQATLAARARFLGHAVSVAQEKAEAVAAVSGRFQALLEVLVQREPAGVTPLLDQRIIEASSITLHRRASQAALEAQAALLELNQLQGQPPATPLRITGGIAIRTNLPPLPALTATAATNNFEVRQRQVELEQQGFRVHLSRNERYPKVTVAPFYSAETANDEQRIVGLGVTLPLPLWSRNTGNIEASQARLQQAEASLRAAWRQVERKLAEHALALRTKVDEMGRWRLDARQRFQEAADLADRHYRLGAVPVTTYVEMQMRYLDALEALLATRGEALEHWQQLELLVGQPLEEPVNRRP